MLSKINNALLSPTKVYNGVPQKAILWDPVFARNDRKPKANLHNQQINLIKFAKCLTFAIFNDIIILIMLTEISSTYFYGNREKAFW